MFVPKVRFEIGDPIKEAELLLSFAGEKRWAAVFEKVYPELKPIQNQNGSKEEILKKYQEFSENIHKTKNPEILDFKEKLQNEWDKIGSDFLRLLAKSLETSWPEDKPEIVGYISILPVFPRFLDEYSFCVGYKGLENMIEVSAHEITHFLWFKKWKEVFPESKREEYESPNLIWRLSEIMDPIILQCNPEINKLIKPKKWGYSSFENIKIGQVGMTEYFKNIYFDCLNAQLSFEDILKKLWREAKKHELEISKF